jgi:hypothetical protein
MEPSWFAASSVPQYELPVKPESMVYVVALEVAVE